METCADGSRSSRFTKSVWKWKKNAYSWEIPWLITAFDTFFVKQKILFQKNIVVTKNTQSDNFNLKI